MPIYSKSTRFLMKDMVDELGLIKGNRLSKDQAISWFKNKYPKIKQGTILAHLVRMSTNATSRHHFSPKVNEDDLFFRIDSSTFRLYDPKNDPSPLHGKITEIEVESKLVDYKPDDKEFAYEKDLQNFLSQNLSLIEPGLELFKDEGINGIEYPAGGRYIDILAVDKNDNYVVIELKVSRGYDRVIGQLLRYISWLKINQAEPNQRVRGIIIAREISNDLILACTGQIDIELFEYQLSVSLNRVGTKL